MAISAHHEQTRGNCARHRRCEGFGRDALNVLASALLFNNRKIIFERVATWQLPAIYQWPEMAEDEGLLGYGPRIIQIYRDLISRQVVKVLRGIKPADIPVEQPTRFELVINLKAARYWHKADIGLCAAHVCFRG